MPDRKCMHNCPTYRSRCPLAHLNPTPATVAGLQLQLPADSWAAVHILVSELALYFLMWTGEYSTSFRMQLDIFCVMSPSAVSDLTYLCMYVSMQRGPTCVKWAMGSGSSTTAVCTAMPWCITSPVQHQQVLWSTCSTSSTPAAPAPQCLQPQCSCQAQLWLMLLWLSCRCHCLPPGSRCLRGKL